MADTGAGMGQGDFSELQDAVRELTGEAREALSRLSDELELPRRMREQPMVVLGAAAAAGFVLGGGLWPVLRPLVKAAARSALSPGNLLAVGAALGALRAAQSRTADDGESPSPETH